MTNLASLQDGWYDGYGLAIKTEYLERTTALVAFLVSKGIPYPSWVLPGVEGNLDIEWEIDNGDTLSLWMDCYADEEPNTDGQYPHTFSLVGISGPECFWYNGLPEPEYHEGVLAWLTKHGIPRTLGH